MNENLELICGLCRYFQGVDAQSGNCHRYPPAYAGDASPREIHHWRYPLVSARNWCGEFLARAA